MSSNNIDIMKFKGGGVKTGETIEWIIKYIMYYPYQHSIVIYPFQMLAQYLRFGRSCIRACVSLCVSVCVVCVSVYVFVCVYIHMCVYVCMCLSVSM